MRGLVLARVGARSLHRSWIEPGTPRDWDLRLVPYQPIPSQDDVDCVVEEVVPGPKWTGLREVLRRWDGWREYDHVWLPDDDLLVDQDGISRLFALADGAHLDLFAPAMHDASHFAHFSAMRNHSFFGRRTGFVEIMMPGFSVRALEELLPTLDLTETGWGWGLDSLWPKLLDYQGVGILDAVPVLHTRPVGQMRDAGLARRVRAESDRIMADHACRQVHTTFSAFGPDLTTLDLAPARFFADLVAGWQHLIDADPRILTWLVDYQRDRLPSLPYPVEGTP
ncbi:hypothetical protein [Aeromicrobium sp. 179-A 4D2 NHS]|uniref:hypothetical protein n=1 Tax=Aeromicrobium sp. 179-A 4D2 NHS TaxID=3142375 RepID=UPI0039A0646F